MQRVLVIALFLVFLSACKKDKLEGDTTILIGKWKWIYTEKWDLTHYNNNNTYSPISEGNNYSVEFTHTGKIYTYKNDKKEKCFRIIFDPPPPDFINSNGEFGAYIYPNNKKKNAFQSFIKKDTLGLRGFYPFKESDPNNYSIYNYFTREN